MFSKELEEIIEAALADGTITDKERAVLHKRAMTEGVDPDELDVLIDGRLAKTKKNEDSLRQTSQKKSATQKLGNIVKCPNCGAQTKGGLALCPECGFEFVNVSANSVVELLQEKLDKINRGPKKRPKKRSDDDEEDEDEDEDEGITKAKMDIISTFPVPNTRADLLEFLTMLQAKADATGPRSGRTFSCDEDLSYAYWLLFTNCINKARISFPNDIDFQYYYQKYEEQLQRTRGFIGYLRCNPNMRILLIYIILVIASVLWLFNRD